MKLQKNMVSLLFTPFLNLEKYLHISNCIFSGYVHVGTCRVSPDHNFLAYTIDVTGEEHFLLQVKDLQSGTHIPSLRVENVVSLAWAQDSHTLFYTLCDQSQRPYRQFFFFFIKPFILFEF